MSYGTNRQANISESKRGWKGEGGRQKKQECNLKKKKSDKYFQKVQNQNVGL